MTFLFTLVCGTREPLVSIHRQTVAVRFTPIYNKEGHNGILQRREIRMDYHLHS